METASTTQSLLADSSESEDPYDTQECEHIVDAYTIGYSNLLRTVKQKLQHKASKPLPAGMQPPEFLTALATLDTTNPDALQDFLVATQGRSNLPEPVPVGMHDDIQYFIKICDKALHEGSSSAAVPPAKTGDIFDGISAYEAKSVLGRQPARSHVSCDSLAASKDFIRTLASEVESLPVGQTMTTDLKYGLGLGRLCYEYSVEADMEDTGFYVICNAVDKSIWVAFDFEPFGETGKINSVRPEFGNRYGKLPLDADDMVIGIMRLFSKEWTAKKRLSLDGRDPFCDGAGTPLACRLVAKPAFVADVLDAIKAASAQTAPRVPSDCQMCANLTVGTSLPFRCVSGSMGC